MAGPPHGAPWRRAQPPAPVQIVAGAAEGMLNADWQVAWSAGISGDGPPILRGHYPPVVAGACGAAPAAVPGAAVPVGGRAALPGGSRW
jgi:hypothetical protein